jgi:hypothetical protein
MKNKTSEIFFPIPIFFVFPIQLDKKSDIQEKKLYILNKTSFNIRCMYFVILRQMVHIKIALYILAPCPT